MQRSIEWIHPEGKGIPLVFLHEALGSIGQWKQFPHRLCEALDCKGLIYEREGHGQSPPFSKPRTANYLHEYAWEELPQLLDQLDISEPVNLLGHSDGGSIALLFAARFPDRVHQIVTEAAHVFVEPETLTGIREAQEKYATTDLHEKLARYHGTKTESLFRAWCDTWLSREFYNWNITALLPQIQAPLLAIQGREDEYGTFEQIRSLINDTQGDSEALLVPNCGHIPHVQQPQWVIAEVTRFLGK